MKKLIIVLIGFVFWGCSQKNSNKHLENQETIIIDESKIAFLPYDSTQNILFANCKEIDLTYEELVTVEKILIECVEVYNAFELKQFERLDSIFPERNFDKNQFTIDLDDYKRQYISVVNKQGQKEVWINCFCQAMGSDWKIEEVFVFDGGNCFFNLKINLADKKYYDFMVNGNA